MKTQALTRLPKQSEPGFTGLKDVHDFAMRRKNLVRNDISVEAGNYKLPCVPSGNTIAAQRREYTQRRVYASLRKTCAFPVRETISIEKICTATGSKPRMGFHMMNLLRRFVDVFRIDSMDMNALTGNVNSTTDRVYRPLSGSIQNSKFIIN
jgi:hypothetical protein